MKIPKTYVYSHQQAKSPLALFSILALSVLAVYWPCLQFEFLNFDDGIYVLENSHVNSGLNVENLKWAFSDNAGAHWHPLTWISLMLDCHLYGPSAFVSHAVNVILHIGNTLLLAGFIFAFLGSWRVTALISLLFALHPARIESVAWITERKDVLSVFWGLLSLHVYAFYASAPSVSRYLAFVACFIMVLHRNNV